MSYLLSDEQRAVYRETSKRSSARKLAMLSNLQSGADIPKLSFHSRLDVNDLMPQLANNGFSCLSLFSGGGGLDLGFERAGFSHSASFEILDVCGQTLRINRPGWAIYSGTQAGDVRLVDFSKFKGVDIVHGGPPCQPFSIAGKQAGINDPRNMWPDFIRCVLQSKPRVFIAENVPGLLDKKFDSFVSDLIVNPLIKEYEIFKFKLVASDFGVPQSRKRVFFVGFRSSHAARRWVQPIPTHGNVNDLFGPILPHNKTRTSIGLPNIGWDTLAPTLRSGFTGPRNSTSILNSKAALKIWNKLEIWPNGVQTDRIKATAFVPENGHFRLSVDDCALLQGFPGNWRFSGAAYQILGQIGNSVCPPVAYAVARNVAIALGK